MQHSSKTEWPMDRRDPQMTGRTPLKGDMRHAPKVVWRHYLGLWTNHLIVNARPEHAEHLDLPENAFGADYLHVNALDWGLRQAAVDIDGKGTKVQPPNESGAKLAKLLPDVSGLQRIEFDNAFSIGAEANYGRLYAYDDGADKPRLVWQTDRVKDMYSPVVAIADTDLDGQPEIVLMTHYHIAIYDAQTGQVKDSVSWNVGRNYGQLDVVDVDGDGYPDFVVQADAPPHLEFIRNSADGAHLVWSHKYLKDEADVAVPTEFYLHNLPNAVRDLDGDGRIEIAVNIHDFGGDRRWHVVVFDAQTGEAKTDLVDRYLWAVTDLEDDGHFEFFLSEAPDKTVERDAKLYVGTYLGTPRLIQRWESEADGQFCMRPYFFPDTVNSASSRGPLHHATVVIGDVDGDGHNEFFVKLGQQMKAIGNDGQVRFTVTSPSDRPPTALAVSAAGQALVELHAASGQVTVDGGTATLASHYQAGHYRTTPIVADLNGNGSNQIVVENAAGFIEAIDPKTRAVQWAFRGYGQPIWVTWKTAHGPTVAIDLDGDGKKEVLCSDAGDERYTTIYALRHDGSVYWKAELAGLGPRLTETFRVGWFRPEGWDVIITVQPNTQPEMLCLDGRTGEVRWHQKFWTDDAGRAWPYPNQFMCYDGDGDGFHEVYGSYAYIYYVLDGKTGAPLRKPINIWHEVFKRWQAYFVPVPADYDGDGQTEFLLASSSFAIGGLTVVTPTMEALWEKALPNAVGARGLQGIGDCDGDGLPEIACYHLDGRIACYDGKTGEVKWEVGNVRCHGNMSGGHFTSGDIDGDGRDEFLYPLASKELIALDHDAPNHVLWRASLSAEPDTAILADVDGDGLAEIVVCTSDGYLNVLK